MYIVNYKNYDSEYYSILTTDTNKQKSIINLDREGKNPRKDIAKWDELKDYFSYFYLYFSYFIYFCSTDRKINYW